MPLRLWLPLLLLTFGLGSARQDAYLWLYGGGTYAPDQDVRLEYSLPPGQTGTLILYRIGNPERVLELGGPANFSGASELDLEPLETLEARAEPERYYSESAFGPLTVGLYFAQLESGQERSATLILVSDLSLVLKSDPNTVLAYTAEGRSGQPRQAEVYLLRGGERYAEGLANEQGLTEFTTDTDESLVVAAQYGDAWAFSESYWNRWALENVRIYLQTDRPVYRPGQTVFFKGTARSPSGLRPLAGEAVQVLVYDAEGSQILEQGFTTDLYGSFAGELTLGVEPPLGSYSIEARYGGESHYGSFQVEAYQKPEYRVTVVPEAANAVQGDTARFTIAGEYLFGGPVAGGKVTYAVLKEPYSYWSYRSYYGFYEEADYSYYYGGELILRGEGVLDENGELALELPLPPDEQDYRLTVQAGVTDEARREISGSGSLRAFRSSLVLDVRSDRYAYQEGETAQVTVRAADLSGNPVSVDFRVDTERYVWEAGTGSRSIRGQTYRGRTDADGTATIAVPLGEQGSYTFTARAQDEAGRETSSQDSLWVSGDERWYWAYDGLSITTDKEEYALGETARFVIQSPIPDAYALVSLEGQAIESYELVRLEGSVLTYELPITQGMTPNGYLSVVIVGEGVTYFETAGFRVPPADKFLNVEVTSDSDQYEPGDIGTFELRVSDFTGQGVRSQLTLALVDEAIYLLRPDGTPDIRGFFYALRPNLVSTQLSDWYYFGGAEALESAADAAAPMAARAEMDEAVFAQGKADFAPADLREDFRDTILWLPTIETDDEGRATVQVTFPDNLTEWRLSAKAITLGDEVGQNTYTVQTTLPVIARLAAPRFFIRGDAASLRVIGQNNLENDLAGRLELAADGLNILNPEPVQVNLPAFGNASADFTIRSEETGTASLTASALTPDASDALKLPIPVLPHGLRNEIGWADSGSSAWRFTLPETTDLTTAKGTLYLTPSLAAAVAPALSYLAGYPYGCTEQTMSRFYPSILAAQAGDLANLPEDIAANLDDIVAQGLKRIYDFQHEDGGWGFWQYDASSAFISAYVVMGLLDARDAGYGVNENVLSAALDYLSRVTQTETMDEHRVVDADARAYAYYALSRAGRDISGLERLLGHADMSPYGLALSVLALHEAGSSVEANLYLDELLSQATERERVAYWETGAPDYYWNDDRIEATAYALEALAKLRPADPLVGKVVNWLLLERQGARWVSTKDTAAVVKAALVLAEATGEVASDYQVSVTLNGQNLLETRIAGQARDSFEVPLEGLQRGDNALELSIEGDGSLYASASVAYFSEQDRFTPQSDAFNIRRSYELLTPVYDEETASYGYERSPLEGAAAVGDYLLVTVSLEPQDDYRYVLVNEPLPAGYRVIEDDGAFRVAGLEPRYGWDYWGWNYWYDGRDVRDERVDYYFSYLGEPVSFTYILRAETPGEFSALPTQAWLMYEPEVRGNGPDATLTVQEQ